MYENFIEIKLNNDRLHINLTLKYCLVSQKIVRGVPRTRVANSATTCVYYTDVLYLKGLKPASHCPTIKESGGSAVGGSIG